MKQVQHVIYFSALLVAFWACRQETNKVSKIDALKTDYTADLLGTDNPAPMLSWQMDDPRTGATQSAFQVLAATSPELLEDGKADLWDSGKLEGPQNKIIYNGKPLKSSSKYYWTARLWDHKGKATNFGEAAVFETAYLDASEWKGKWITNTEDTTSQPAPYFRKTVETKPGLKRATAYVAGVGYHELYVNGEKTSDKFLEPGYTRFDRRTLYVTYDITDFLKEGKNGLGVLLGNGWYNTQTKAVWYFEKAPWRKTPRLLMDIRLEYEDGTIEFVSTDDSWKFGEGAMQFNSLYAGEIYDARLEQDGWASADFDDSAPKLRGKPVLLTDSPGGVLSAQTAPAIEVVRTIKPVQVFPLGEGRFVFDMGENFAGTARLKIKGEKGTKVTMLFGEQISEDNSVDPSIIARHMRIPEGNHPFQTDIYILKGEGEETYVPRFTYHGYQYVEVKTEPAIELTAENLEGLFLSTGFEEAGSFKCSNELLNKLYAATKQSYLSNFYSIPTDCPHREKNGWTGDAHISCELGLWNYDGIMPYRKWLQDLRDEQRPTGELPGIVPTSGWGYHWGNGPAWDSALPIIAWTLYEYYGDTTVLKENYDAVKLYVDYLGTRTENGIQSIGLGDWVALVKTPVEITSTGYYYHDALILSKMAAILGKTEDQQKYSDLAEKIKTVFNETFLDTVTNRYKVQTQTALSCAIFQGLAPEEAIENTVNDLIEQIKLKNNHPDFGLLGSKYVLNVLRESGNNELAYRMINQTEFPSWGHWIEQGATALWEDWDGREGSQNHIFLGDFTTWFFKALGGIQLDPENPGFSHFFIKPYFEEDISFVECSHNCLYGKIVSNWKRMDKNVEMDITIPANTGSTFQLPEGYKLAGLAGAKGKNVNIDLGANEVKLVSGQYKLVLEKAE
jgi:alpha-L-rhamnosidase